MSEGEADGAVGQHATLVDRNRYPTAVQVADRRDHSAPQLLRRGFLVLLILVVLLGASGFLGVHSATRSVTGQGYTMTLRYPQIARAGQDVPWRVRIEHPGGFDKDIVVAVSARYFDIFETQGFHPQPDSESSDGSLIYLTFSAPPAGDTFTADFDTYVQPASQLGRSADVVLIIGGQRLAQLHYTTWLVP